VTNDELAFLRAAAVNPEDDALRLAYADWLDEQGGETFAAHAGLVRLQVRRSRLDVFDPAWGTLLEEETRYLQKYKRDLNGRIHYSLHRKGLRGLVDSRRGLIRGWDYHRGMIARVSASVGGLTAHSELVFSLGPIESVRIVGWQAGDGWVKAAGTFRKLLPRLKLLVLVGTYSYPSLPDLSQLGPLDLVPLLDLRCIHGAPHGNQLLALARSGKISPVVLFRHGAQIERSYLRGGRQYTQREWREVDHVIDPFKQWDELRLWFADFTGEVLSPVRYKGTSR